MDANTQAASDAVTQLNNEKKDLLAQIKRKQARVAIIEAQLAALQPLTKPTPPAAPAQPAK